MVNWPGATSHHRSSLEPWRAVLHLICTMLSPDLQTAHCQRRCDGGGQRGEVTEERYGPQTVAVIAELQRRAGVTGPDADGTTVGPRTWAAPKSHRDDCVTTC
jgi:hypothetical protein